MAFDSCRGDFVVALEERVARLLGAAEIDGPPVDAIRVARTLGIGVIFDASQEPRGRQARVGGRVSIFIRPDERRERIQWAVAHELGETLSHELFHQAGFDPEDVDPQSREQGANLAAARLLLPSLWFVQDAERLAGDLLSLKGRYETASHELIAFRLLDLPEPAVVTVFDQGRQSRRRGNGVQRVPPLDRLEQDCWLAIRRFHQPHEIKGSGRRVQGWPIHEPGWQREILRTTAEREEWE